MHCCLKLFEKFAARRTLLSVESEKPVEKMEQDVDDDEEETVTQVKSEFS